MTLPFRRSLIAVPLLGLAGCKLIDQTTFAPSPSTNPVLTHPAPASPAAQTRVDTRTPLLVIDQGTPVSAYGALLRGAAAAARRRDPNVQFDVTIVVPAQGDAVASVSAAQPEAAAAMQEIAAAGIPASSLHLRAATDANLTHRQIRVYVR